MRPASLRVALLAAVLTLAASASTTTALGAQDARVFNDVDTTLVTVGDRIRMTVTVDHLPGARVLWPDSVSLAPFEVLGAEALPPVTEGSRVRSSIVLTLTAFQLGELEIPSLDIGVEGPGPASAVLRTDPFGIEVVSVGADESGDIRDIRGPLGIPVGVVTVSLWGLVLLALVVFAVWLWRRMRREEDGLEGEPAVPPRPVDEIALEALARIEADGMLERGLVKEYHIEVSEVLRTFIEHRFDVRALEMTTREVLAGLRGHEAIDEAFALSLQRFLNECDLVKFAKVRPSNEASKAVLELGRELVNRAGPVPPVSEPIPEVEHSPEPESQAVHDSATERPAEPTSRSAAGPSARAHGSPFVDADAEPAAADDPPQVDSGAST